MDTIKAKSLAIRTMGRWGLLELGWKFEFNKRRSALGLCRPHRRTIYLSTYYLDKVSEVETMDTILHEIAHALEFVRHGTSGHGPKWKAICVEVGAKPLRLCSAKIHHPYPYVLKYEGEVVKWFWKLPPDIFKRLPYMRAKNRPETQGKLKLYKVQYVK